MIADLDPFHEGDDGESPDVECLHDYCPHCGEAITLPHPEDWREEITCEGCGKIVVPDPLEAPEQVPEDCPICGKPAIYQEGTPLLIVSFCDQHAWFDVDPRLLEAVIIASKRQASLN
ncbi:MAG: hypothetical protein AAF191_21170 [Verrucomicrobiota bacterium]